MLKGYTQRRTPVNPICLNELTPKPSIKSSSDADVSTIGMSNALFASTNLSVVEALEASNPASSEALPPVMEASSTVLEAPLPVLEASPPVMEASSIVLESPLPVLEASSPVMEASSIVLESPLPVLEASSPVLSPVMEASSPVQQPAFHCELPSIHTILQTSPVHVYASKSHSKGSQLHNQKREKKSTKNRKWPQNAVARNTLNFPPAMSKRIKLEDTGIKIKNQKSSPKDSISTTGPEISTLLSVQSWDKDVNENMPNSHGVQNYGKTTPDIDVILQNNQKRSIPTSKCEDLTKHFLPLSKVEESNFLEQESDNNDEENPLPFLNLPSRWYEQQSRLAHSNLLRTERRLKNPVHINEDSEMISVNRSQVSGSLKDNTFFLKNRMKNEEPTSAIAVHLNAILSVANFICEHGPIVSAKDASKIYLQSKGLTSIKWTNEFYEIVSKHLNVLQIYIHGRAYIVESSGLNMENVVQTIVTAANKDIIVNNRIEERLQGIFKSCLQYLDTHRDRQALKGLFAMITSVKFTASLQDVRSHQGTTKAKKALLSNLDAYADLRKTSMMVRSDLTTKQQYKLTERVIAARKAKEIKTIASGRGRKLKCQHFPELATVLQYAFGELDIKHGGGGLESHPRLTCQTLYKASDSVTCMREARELLLSLAPKGFTLSLSSCYNYTENYRKGSAQAYRHHAGKGVNAQISLARIPRIGVEKLVINLHWSTANVNLLVDSNPRSLIISKDAKAIVPADISPVQFPGKSWKKRVELPDHSWDQSRTNSITPMTFLLLETKYDQLTEIALPLNDKIVTVTRTGQGVTLLYLSFFEADTTFKAMNEILYLVSIPALDQFFRDKDTGSLKKELTFVVDNGPSEQPCCPLVKMCMARLLQFLKLEKITQVSFAEYHSKRNYVERVHAEENRVLSRHGPFKSKEIHSSVTPGSSEHKENMLEMERQVRCCLKQGSFGGRPLLCYRGVTDFYFNDEDCLKNFLALNEDRKSESDTTYQVLNVPGLNDLCITWGLDDKFHGCYSNDYKLIQSELIEERTAWLDKYTSVLYSPIKEDIIRHELQPVPDYLRWLKTCELHYMPYHERCELQHGPWDETPGFFMPSAILNIAFISIPDPPPHIMKLLAILAWVPTSEAQKYYTELQSNALETIHSDLEREKWKDHPLYTKHTKSQLLEMCQSLKVKIAKSSTNKHQLVALLAEKKGEQEPKPKPLYSGKLTQVPCTTSSISKFTIGQLRAILKHHGLPTIGLKDELVIRVFLLRQGCTHAITAKETKQLRYMVEVHNKVILYQRHLNITNHSYHRRKFSSQSVEHGSFESVPTDIRQPSDLIELFSPLISYMEKEEKDKQDKDSESTIMYATNLKASSSETQADQVNELHEAISQVGARIKVKWCKEELGDSGWRPGWYTAVVQSYDSENDTITVEYPSEPGCVYDIEVTPMIKASRLKLLKSVF